MICRNPRFLADMALVESFLKDAAAILETAVNSASADAADIAVLIGWNGNLRMLDASGWTLPALAAEYGAKRTFRIERRRSSVRLEGMSGGRTIVLEQKRWPGALAAGVSPSMIAHTRLLPTP